MLNELKLLFVEWGLNIRYIFSKENRSETVAGLVMYISLAVFGWYAAQAVALMWITWVFFSAVMRLRQLRDAGKLAFKDGPVRFIFAYAALIVGLVLDVLVNFVVATPVMFELPRYNGMKQAKIGGVEFSYPDVEWLTTARLCRWYHSTDTGWWTVHVRMAFVRLGQQLLDVVDTDEVHIK